MFQPEKAAEFGSFSHMVLALELRKQKKIVIESPSVVKESCWGQAYGGDVRAWKLIEAIACNYKSEACISLDTPSQCQKR